jgi:hypothetical protein
MAKQVSYAALEHLFPVDERLPCPGGTIVLRAFAERRPSDFKFFRAIDPVDLRNSAFDGIPEWDDFVDHYSTCELCNA